MDILKHIFKSGTSVDGQDVAHGDDEQVHAQEVAPPQQEEQEAAEEVVEQQPVLQAAEESALETDEDISHDTLQDLKDAGTAHGIVHNEDAVLDTDRHTTHEKRSIHDMIPQTISQPVTHDTVGQLEKKPAHTAIPSDIVTSTTQKKTTHIPPTYSRRAKMREEMQAERKAQKIRSTYGDETIVLTPRNIEK